MTDDERYAYQEKISLENNLKNSFWSADEVDNFEAEHPYRNITKVVYYSDPYWGKPSGYFSEEIKGNRWLDLWIAADKIMEECGDKHHYFIEGFILEYSTGITPYLNLSCGS